MSELFIIRGYHWGYNDEVYYPAGNYIKSTFTDETEAKTESEEDGEGETDKV